MEHPTLRIRSEMQSILESSASDDSVSCELAPKQHNPGSLRKAVNEASAQPCPLQIMFLISHFLVTTRIYHDNLYSRIENSL